MEDAMILLDLKKSMKIKQIKLKNDEEREKNYLKRILQARMCSIHPNDEMTKSIPLWTSRKTFKFWYAYFIIVFDGKIKAINYWR